jgi:hypothetical protein
MKCSHEMINMDHKILFISNFHYLYFWVLQEGPCPGQTIHAEGFLSAKNIDLTSQEGPHHEREFHGLS